jgi:hypothetical protein
MQFSNLPSRPGGNFINRIGHAPAVKVGVVGRSNNKGHLI